MDNLIGRDLGRYHILEPLGEGGMDSKTSEAFAKHPVGAEISEV